MFGLSATPWRSRDDESKTLRRYFKRNLVRPDSLGTRPIKALQKRKILAGVEHERLRVRDTEQMTTAQWRRFEKFKDLPLDYLNQLGLSAERNAQIIRRLVQLPKKRRAIVFARSIAHAEILTVALNQALGSGSSAVVTGQTPRAERADVIERFRSGHLRSGPPARHDRGADGAGVVIAHGLPIYVALEPGRMQARTPGLADRAKRVRLAHAHVDKVRDPPHRAPPPRAAGARGRPGSRSRRDRGCAGGPAARSRRTGSPPRTRPTTRCTACAPLRPPRWSRAWSRAGLRCAHAGS